MTMRLSLVGVVLAVGLTIGATSETAMEDGKAGTYKIDPSHSMVIFKIQHLGVSNFYGRFNQLGGTVVVAEDLAECSVELEVDVSSIDTNGERRDGHLESPDFFDAANQPKLTFESKKWKKSGANRYQVTGPLGLLGVTKEITAEVERIGSGETLFKDYRSGFEARFTLKRSDFGMLAYLENGGLGDEVSIIVAVEGILEGSGPGGR